MNEILTGEIILYPREDGSPALQVRLEGETVWLTQDQMAELFGKAKSTINEHIKNVFAEGELNPGQAMRKFGISEFSTKPRISIISHLSHTATVRKFRTVC